MNPLKWRDVITERDGETPCFVRVLTLIGVLSFVALTVFGLMHGQAISYSEWAIGFTTIVAGGAGAARIKLETESPEEVDDVPAADNHTGADRDWRSQ